MNRTSLCLATTIALGTAFVGCEAPINEDEPRLDSVEQLAVGEIPWWIAEKPTELGCGLTVKDQFSGWDSAHMYRFFAKAGYRFSFDFEGDYPDRKGAGVAVYDAKTGELLAFDGQRWQNTARIEIEPEEHTEYLVAVMSAKWRTRGNYILTTGCELQNFCLEFETVAEDGTPYNNFYVLNVGSEAEAQEVLDNLAPYDNAIINRGTCAEQLSLCNKMWAPVCADTPLPQGTHGNVCEFKAHVREQAGESGQYKGHFEVGECEAQGQFCGGILGLICPSDYSCVLDGDYPDAGGTCELDVCDYGGRGYPTDATFPATDGCNTCQCQADGTVACTEMACACSPDDHNRSYVSRSPEQCQVVRYSCPDNTTSFSDNCGCGCEQDATCPEWFNCMPGPQPACDTDLLKSTCPFSDIAY